MNSKIIARLYAVISISLAILILTEGLVREHIKNLVIVKVIDYTFWYVFGLFSAFFILWRILVHKDRNDKENLLSPN